MLALGSPGGSTIITTVAQILVNRFERGLDIEAAVAAPRASQRNAAIHRCRAGLPDHAGGDRPARPRPQLRSGRRARAPRRRSRSSDSGTLTAVAEPERRGGGAAAVVKPRHRWRPAAGLACRHADDQWPSGAPRGAGRAARVAALLEQLPRLRRPRPRARGGGRRRAALRRGRRCSTVRLGHDERARSTRAAAGGVSRNAGGGAVRLGLSGEHRRDRSADRRRSARLLRRAQPRWRSSTGAGSPARRRSSTSTATQTISPGGCSSTAIVPG